MVLRTQGAIRSRSPWPPAEPWPERPAAQRQKRKNRCRETTGHLSVGTQNSKVSQRPDNRLVEAGEPLQIHAPVLYELSDQPVVLVAAS